MIEHNGLSGYLARADDADFAVLLLPDIHGLSADNKSICDDLGAVGITALAWDPWHGPTGDECTHDELVAKMAALDDEQVIAEQRTWLDYLQGLGISQFATMGFCLGGRLVFLLAAADERIESIVAYHPSIMAPPWPNQTIDAYAAAAKTDAAVLVHYPQQDSLIPMSVSDELTTALRGRDGAISIVGVYGSAQHGFGNRARRDAPENRRAWAISWPQTVQFLRSTR